MDMDYQMSSLLIFFGLYLQFIYSEPNCYFDSTHSCGPHGFCCAGNCSCDPGFTGSRCENAITGFTPTTRFPEPRPKSTYLCNNGNMITYYNLCSRSWDCTCDVGRFGDQCQFETCLCGYQCSIQSRCGRPSFSHVPCTCRPLVANSATPMCLNGGSYNVGSGKCICNSLDYVGRYCQYFLKRCLPCFLTGRVCAYKCGYPKDFICDWNNFTCGNPVQPTSRTVA